MELTYPTIAEFSKKIKYDIITIRKGLNNSVLIDGTYI